MAMIASVPGFDTLACARRLKEAGVDEAQAEARVEAVAIKADLAAVVALVKLLP